MGKFSAIAYWSFAVPPSGWIDAAQQALKPLNGWAEIEVSNLHKGGQERLSIRLPGAEATMLIAAGNARGTVPADNPRAIELVVVLMALRRAIPTLSLADDDGNEIPHRLTQNYPLFGDRWDAVQDIGERLGLVPSKRFFEEMGVGVLHDLMF